MCVAVLGLGCAQIFCIDYVHITCATGRCAFLLGARNATPHNAPAVRPAVPSSYHVPLIRRPDTHPSLSTNPHLICRIDPFLLPLPPPSRTSPHNGALPRRSRLRDSASPFQTHCRRGSAHTTNKPWHTFPAHSALLRAILRAPLPHLQEAPWAHAAHPTDGAPSSNPRIPRRPPTTLHCLRRRPSDKRPHRTTTILQAALLHPPANAAVPPANPAVSRLRQTNPRPAGRLRAPGALSTRSPYHAPAVQLRPARAAAALRGERGRRGDLSLSNGRIRRVALAFSS